MRVALTFDTEHPGRPTTPGAEDRILAALADRRVRATFFLQGLDELGYRHVGWDVDPRDWEEGRTVQELIERVAGGVSGTGNDAVVLLHGWPAVTAEGLALLLARLAESGARL